MLILCVDNNVLFAILLQKSVSVNISLYTAMLVFSPNLPQVSTASAVKARLILVIFPDRASVISLVLLKPTLIDQASYELRDIYLPLSPKF